MHSIPQIEPAKTETTRLHTFAPADGCRERAPNAGPQDLFKALSTSLANVLQRVGPERYCHLISEITDEAERFTPSAVEFPARLGGPQR